MTNLVTAAAADRAFATKIGEQLEECMNNGWGHRANAIVHSNRHLIIAALYRLGEAPDATPERSA